MFSPPATTITTFLRWRQQTNLVQVQPLPSYPRNGNATQLGIDCRPHEDIEGGGGQGNDVFNRLYLRNDGASRVWDPRRCERKPVAKIFKVRLCYDLIMD